MKWDKVNVDNILDKILSCEGEVKSEELLEYLRTIRKPFAAMQSHII